MVELNRAVAVSHADGPGAGLAIIDAIADDPQLAGCHPLLAVRADLLAQLGRHHEAQAEFARAAAMTTNDAERELLLRRARDLG